jgi:hypothetical protein
VEIENHRFRSDRSPTKTKQISTAVVASAPAIGSSTLELNLWLEPIATQKKRAIPKSTVTGHLPKVVFFD